jgi:hypothetical protein
VHLLQILDQMDQYGLMPPLMVLQLLASSPKPFQAALSGW